MFSVSENHDTQFSTSCANILILFYNKWFNFSLTHLHFLILLGKYQYIVFKVGVMPAFVEHCMFSWVVTAIFLPNCQISH